MKLGIAKENLDDRVAIAPATLPKIQALGLEVLVEDISNGCTRVWFGSSKTKMLFGDAKDSLGKLVRELKDL